MSGDEWSYEILFALDPAIWNNRYNKSSRNPSVTIATVHRSLSRVWMAGRLLTPGFAPSSLCPGLSVLNPTWGFMFAGFIRLLLCDGRSTTTSEITSRSSSIAYHRVLTNDGRWAKYEVRFGVCCLLQITPRCPDSAGKAEII